jgi:membrane-bound serine protease (ClpP class)
MRTLVIALRVLGTALLVTGSVLGLAGRAAVAATDSLPHVDVIQVNGLIDPIVADFIRHSIHAAETEGATVLVVQLNSGGGVLSPAQEARLAKDISSSPVPVAVWVGPSDAKAKGTAAELVRAAAVAGTSTKTRIGDLSGDAALNQKVVTINAPTLGDFVVNLDGVQPRNGGPALNVPSTVKVDANGTPHRQPAVDVRLAKLGLLARLMHTAASPSVAYLLLVTALLLVVFEYFTAGVGVAAVVGAGFLVLGAYGLAALPARGWAVALIVIAIAGYSIDLQAGVPRFWAGVGTVAMVVGTVFLYHGVRLSLLAMIVGVVGTALMMVAGMPAVIRARFSTPTIGRESMVGEMGTALASVDPDGTVEIRGAQWRARTNRATPIAAGDPIRVVAIDGLLLEVEPETGGAKDARH